MLYSEIIENTTAFVKEKLKNAESGHDWWHIKRVWDLARKISEKYQVNLLIIDLGSLLHDIADAKFNDGDESIGPEITRSFLEEQKVKNDEIDHVVDIVRFISFKNRESITPTFIEFRIIQDADRLDAIGAIGTARAFSYGGYRKREMYNPDITPSINMSDAEYKNNTGPTLNHFNEKLFKIKDLLHTEEARLIARKRHKFMEEYVKQFIEEWNNTDYTL